ncbi:DUF6531 domain-containing protein [Streptomyces sp. NPDC005438]|uniref:putative T7SS-secreted protein n=1 Tax=Streptomyces sp. NPDC005438 TaxID=3156880 RepID=UPI0033BEC1D2
MTQKDAMEGGTSERIPPHAKPSDVIFGDPAKVDKLVVKLRAYAGAFKDGHEKLTDLSVLPWTGAASDSFQEATKRLPKELESAHKYFSSAANALDAYADKLRSVQKRVKPIIEDADEVRAASKRYWKRVKSYNAAVERGDDPLPPRPPDDDPISGLHACYRRLDKLENELQSVLEASRSKLSKAAEKAPDAPKGWDRVKKGVGDFFGGVGDSGKEAWKQFERMVEDGPGGAKLQLAGMADGFDYATAHPKEFAKAMANWDEWQRNPSRAAGQITPDLLLALATGGGNALRKGGSAVKDAAARLASRERALGRDGSAARRADGEPHKNDKCSSERCGAGEPVDVATGEMFMSATDVDLPGTLPLVLERHHVSGHPCGGWFGSSWAGTLDQRLELDDQGVVFVAADGMVLRYPVPEPRVPTMPVSGPRWPLSWDGSRDGGMSVTVPEDNRRLHFSHLSFTGRELALSAITDRTGEGDQVEFHYDEQGTPTHIVHSGGYHVAVDTDPALRRVTSLSLLHGERRERTTRLVSFTYTSRGDLSGVVNSTGKPLVFRYDDEHRITSWEDRNGTAFAYVYDGRGRVLRTVGPSGILSGHFHYDDDQRTTRYTDSQGNSTTYVYNEAYKVIAVTDPLGHTTRTTWDTTNRLRTSVTDPLGHITRYTYDDHGNLTRVELPDGHFAEAAYDNDLPVQVREPNGATWRHTYDDHGARTSTTDPAGSTTRWAYDDTGHLSALTDALGRTTEVVTDPAGLPVAVTDPLGHTTHVNRGPHGRVTAVTDPLGRTTRLGWTIEGKPAWRHHPDGTREEWKWDGEGNLAQHVDQAGHVTAYTHAHFDLPATRTDPDGAHYTFDYDTELRLTTVTNPQGATWRYEYDRAGRLTAETDFNGARRTYELDDAGHLTAQTNAAQQTLRYTRDPLGRLVTKHDLAIEETTSYTYDPLGNLTHASTPQTALDIERDVLGRVVTETVNGQATTFTYDAVGNRLTRTTPSGLTTTWAYDPADRPRTLHTPDTSLALAHDAAGQETQRTLGATTLHQDWDETRQLTAQTVTVGGDLIQHRTYRYSPDGYVTQIRDLTSGTRDFHLDPVGRVTQVQAHGWTEGYSYDSAGNQAHASAPEHPAPGDRNVGGTLIHRAGRTTYHHDDAGRVIRKTRKLLNGQLRTWTYTWSTEDRLLRATTPDGETWTYTYDPLGRRLSKTNNQGTSLTFSWDGTRLAEQRSPDHHSLTWEYTPRTHRPVTQTTHHPEPGTPQTHAVVTDAVGTPTELLAPDGTLTWQAHATLWGTPLPSPPQSTACPLRYPGQYADPETALHYNYFRYYDPETARYLTPDPLGLSPAPNPHAYIRNPLTWMDPLGLAPDNCRRDRGRREVPEYFPQRERAGDLTKYVETQDTRDPASQWYHEMLSNEELLDSINHAPSGDGILISPEGRVVGGHHRRDELLSRIKTGQIDPNTIIRFDIFYNVR